MDKFIEKNKESIDELDKFIDENRGNIYRIIIPIDLYNHLKSSIEIKQLNTDDVSSGRYKGMRIIVDQFAPPNHLRFLLRNNPKIEFNLPCVCGIWPGEPHP